MGYFSQKIITVLVGAGVLVQIKFVARTKRAAVAGAGNHVMQGLFFFHAKFGDGIAFGFLGMDTGIIIDFIFCVAADFGDGLDIGHQGAVGSLKIIVGKSVLAGTQFLLGAPAFHNVFLQEGAAGSVVEAHFMLYGTVLVNLRFVGEYQLVAVLIVLKEIENAIFLHQASDKIVGSLAVLDDVFALGVTALSAVLKILEAVVLEDFFDDFGNSLILKNLAIGGTRQEPQPRNDFRTLTSEPIVTAQTGEPAHVSIPGSLVVARIVNL